MRFNDVSISGARPGAERTTAKATPGSPATAAQPIPAKEVVPEGADESASFEPVPKRELASWERALIREVMAQGIGQGESEEQLRARRLSLVGELDCTEHEVVGLTTHLRTKANALLREPAFAGALPGEALIGLWGACTTSKAEEQERLVQALATRLAVAPEHITALHQRYVASIADSVTAPEPALWSDGAPTPADASSDATLSAEGAETARARVRGEHANYDNATKEQWRAAWLAFLLEHLPPEVRPHAKVLCLPSEEPEREIALYRQLGIPMKNIIGVEGGDPEARARFTANAQKLGIRALVGRLEDLLPELQKHVFHVVSLDFLGQLCTPALEILSSLRLGTHACVLVNLKGNRESREMQELLRDSAAGDAALHELFTSGATPLERAQQYKAVVTAHREGRREYQDLPLGEVRRDHLTRLLSLSLLGEAHRHGPYATRLEKLRQETYPDIGLAGWYNLLALGTHLLSGLVGEVMHGARGALPAGPLPTAVLARLPPALRAEVARIGSTMGTELDLRKLLAEFARTALQNGALACPRVSAAQTYRYNSEASARRSPFQSAFLATQSIPARDFDRHWKKVCDFLMTGLEYHVRSLSEGGWKAAAQIEMGDHGPELWIFDAGRTKLVSYIEVSTLVMNPFLLQMLQRTFTRLHPPADNALAAGVTRPKSPS